MIEIRHTEPDSAALRRAYDSFYSVRTTEHARSYYRWILRQLQPRPASLLLDVCCGTGVLAEEAAALGVRAVGVDFAVGALRDSRAAVGAADALALPFGAGTFDYVVNLGSLEHLEDMRRGVAEMARVLKPDGTCCVLVPNTFGLLWTVRVARHTGDIDDDGQPLQRYATRRQWERLLATGGLHAERVVGYELPPPETLADWRAYADDFWFKLLPLALWRFVPVNIASMLVFFCRRGEPTP